MADASLKMWTIYERPRDYPDCYVARLWLIEAGKTIATSATVIADNPEVIREKFQYLGLVRILRSPEDDPKILETWL